MRQERVILSVACTHEFTVITPAVQKFPTFYLFSIVCVSKFVEDCKTFYLFPNFFTSFKKFLPHCSGFRKHIQLLEGPMVAFKILLRKFLLAQYIQRVGGCCFTLSSTQVVSTLSSIDTVLSFSYFECYFQSCEKSSRFFFYIGYHCGNPLTSPSILVILVTILSIYFLILSLSCCASKRCQGSLPLPFILLHFEGFHYQCRCAHTSHILFISPSKPQETECISQPSFLPLKITISGSYTINC